MKCQECGRDNADRYKFCLNCGAQLEDPVTGLLKEAQDFEEFDLIAEAIEKMEKVVQLAPDSIKHRKKLDELRARLRSLGI